jgi:hypothetical protein
MNRLSAFASFLLSGMLACASPIVAQSDGALDTKFLFRLSLFTEGERLGLSADVTTTSTYPCVGFGIQVRQVLKADTIAISIGGMIRPNPCLQASDIASTKMFIGPLINSTYVLRISYRGTEDMYLLAVRKGQYSITPLYTTFTEIESL